MRFQSITLSDYPPVERFEAAGLSDVIVIAGPNGVGKTRLLQRLLADLRGNSGAGTVSCVVRSTCPEELVQWGIPELDLSDASDLDRFRQTIQATRRRRKWKSSIVNFESDRSLRNVAPLAYSFDMPDPEQEEVGWDFTFGFMRDRYQDTVHSMFRMIEVQKQSIATRAIQLRREGRETMQLTFTDPMEPFKDVFRQLLGPKQLVDPSPSNQRLEYSIDGVVFPFDSLSSGEREVVTIAFDLLLRKPEDCIVFFDEPELHLHPELSFRLIQTLQTIGPRNQLVLSTHSPDIITSSLDRSVIFLSPPKVDPDGRRANQAILVDEADETNQALRLLGHSIGIIALGRRIILVEGSQSSVDKQAYGSIIKNRWPDLVLVPSGGRHTLESFETIYSSVLSKSIWGVEFFMLCDGDTRPTPSEEEREAKAGGRLRVLPRYHLENYFLDEQVWAEAFAPLEPPDSWLRDPERIRSAFIEISREHISYTAALRAAQGLRLSVGNVDAMPKNCHGRAVDELVELVLKESSAERDRTAAVLADDKVERLVREEFERTSGLLDAGDPEWQQVIPGKPIVSAFSKRAGLKLGHAKTLYLAAAEEADPNPFADVIAIFSEFAKSGNEEMQ
jgi:AAA domain, putative AbiEii toxin, Type IV TA system